MNKISQPDINKSDLSVFPPHMSHFLLVTFFLMVSHGIATTLVCHFYLSLSVGTLVIAVISTGMALVFFNILLVRGNLSGKKGLLCLAITYLLIGLSALLGLTNQAINFWLTATLITSSTLAIVTMKGKKYQTMINFMAKRWHFYRVTGRTIVEEMNTKKTKGH